MGCEFRPWLQEGQAGGLTRLPVAMLKQEQPRGTPSCQLLTHQRPAPECSGLGKRRGQRGAVRREEGSHCSFYPQPLASTFCLQAGAAGQG